MWRKCCSSATSLFIRRLFVNGLSGSSSPVYYGTLGLSAGVSFIPSPPVRSNGWFCTGLALFSSSVDSGNFTGVRRDVDKSESGGGPGIGSVNGESGNGITGEAISFGEAKRLMRLVNVEALKTKLGTDGKEAIGYLELIEACKSMGVARSEDEAAAFARVLDEAGVVLLFRDKVYLHPDKVGELRGDLIQLSFCFCIVVWVCCISSSIIIIIQFLLVYLVSEIRMAGRSFCLKG